MRASLQWRHYPRASHHDRGKKRKTRGLDSWPMTERHHFWQRTALVILYRVWKSFTSRRLGSSEEIPHPSAHYHPNSHPLEGREHCIQFPLTRLLETRGPGSFLNSGNESKSRIVVCLWISEISMKFWNPGWVALHWSIRAPIIIPASGASLSIVLHWLLERMTIAIVRCKTLFINCHILLVNGNDIMINGSTRRFTAHSQWSVSLVPRLHRIPQLRQS